MSVRIGKYRMTAEPAGDPGFSDDFSVNIKAEDANATPDDASTFAMTVNLSDSNADLSEAVKLDFPSGVWDDDNTAPTDSNNFSILVWMSGSSGTDVTNASNADGENDGSVAQLRTATLGTNPITMTSLIGANVPSITVSNVTYRGYFKSVNQISSSTGKVTAKSNGALFSDIVMYSNSASGNTDDYLDGSFTYDLYAAGVDTLAKLQSLEIEHYVSDLAAGVTPHTLTVDAANVEVSGAFT